MPLNHDLRKVLLRPSCCLLSNKTGFLHLSCSQDFSLEVDFTNIIVPFSQLPVAINFDAEGLTSDTFAQVYVRFLLSYKFYVISCFNQLHHLSTDCLARELRSVSGLAFFLRKVPLYSTFICFSAEDTCTFCLLLSFSCLDCRVLRFFSKYFSPFKISFKTGNHPW